MKKERSRSNKSNKLVKVQENDSDLSRDMNEEEEEE